MVEQVCPLEKRGAHAPRFGQSDPIGVPFRSVLRFWVTLSLAVVTVVSAVPAGESRSAPAELPNLVVFLTDTLRADRVSAYGHHRETTPVFDELARRGFLFTNAYAPSPWTRPSVASLFTGQYPQRHGVQMRHDKLPAAIPTLAERLRQQGMRTICVTTNPHVTRTWGMTRGFDRVIEMMPNQHKLKAGNGALLVHRRVKQLIPSLEAPFFLYVHLIDPHWPYEPPEVDLRAIGVRRPTDEERLLYQGEIHFADRYVGRMMDDLDAAGHLDTSVVVMTSDHGEELWDHGLLGHGKTVYQEVVRVPLALHLPPATERHVLAGRKARRVIDDNVSLVDLMPTLLNFYDLAPPPRADGQDLTPLMRGAGNDPRPLFVSVEKEQVSHAAVVLETAKLIVNRASGGRRLFLLEEDPGERGVGIPAGQEETAAHLSAVLESFERSARPGIHLELAGKLLVRDERDLVVSLRTTGRFVDIDKYGFERGDRLQVSPDRSFLRARVTLRSFWHKSPLHIWVQDRDELSFELEPRDAEIEMRVRLDGGRASTAIVRFPRAESGDWPLRFSRADLTASSVVDRRLGGVYLYAQERREVEKVEAISADLEAALEALGYIQ